MPEFDCITCGTKLKAAEAQIGKFVRCPRCKNTMRVPAPGQTATRAPDRNLGNVNPPPGVSPVGAAGGRRYGFNCQYCSSRLEATSAMGGQEGHCPTCGNTIIIPIL